MDSHLIDFLALGPDVACKKRKVGEDSEEKKEGEK